MCIRDSYKAVSCALNPQISREGELEITPAAVKKNIAVVGGGPAGLEAARVLSLRGHSVTVFEKGELGGQLNEEMCIRDSIKVDYTQQKKLAAAVSRVASNINQICRRINSTGHLYAEDVAELKERQAEIWSLLKKTQRKEL